MDLYVKGNLPILDIEMSAVCMHGQCVYCDSPVGKAQTNELNDKEIIKLLEDGNKLGCKWVYVCGLGEPFDDPKFISLMRYCSDNSIGVSLFSNLLGLTNAHIKLLTKMNINMLVKIDSFNSANFDKNLGRKGTAEKIYQNLNKLLDIGFGGNQITNLALSIVPTQYTVKDIPDIIGFCKEKQIFPSIGEIEYSGKAKKQFGKIALSEDDLINLKTQVEKILGYKYRREVCPSSLVGMHISNKGDCIVHAGSGLSCSWFLLNEPEMISLGNVRDIKLGVLNEKMRTYRQSKWRIGEYEIDNKVPNIFGGCGGNKDEIVLMYQKLMEQTEKFNIL